jgi:hypothetical protein
MYCMNCGKKINVNAESCPHCLNNQFESLIPQQNDLAIKLKNQSLGNAKSSVNEANIARSDLGEKLQQFADGFNAQAGGKKLLYAVVLCILLVISVFITKPTNSVKVSDEKYISSNDSKEQGRKFRDELIKNEGLIIGIQGKLNSKWGEGKGKDIPIDDFIQLCKNINGVTKNAFMHVNYVAKGDVRYLLENKGYTGFRIFFDDMSPYIEKQNEKSPCKLEIQVKGMYAGSQVNQDLKFYIASLIITEGKINVFEISDPH